MIAVLLFVCFFLFFSIFYLYIHIQIFDAPAVAAASSAVGDAATLEGFFWGEVI